MKKTLFGFALLIAIAAVAGAGEPIQDNSFLIEEAYNQEPGVVQHISVFQRGEDGNAWEYSFTQEWPFFSQRHQLSYTLPVSHDDGTRLDGIAINYRYQVGAFDARTAVAPRISLLLGNDESDHRRALDVNLPVSFEASERLALHSNFGATYSRDRAGTDEDTTEIHAGQSAVWLATERFNALLEVVWSREASFDSGARDYSQRVVVSPGARWAYNMPGDLQIVPGIAFPIDLASRDEKSVLLYLSFEHPFRR